MNQRFSQKQAFLLGILLFSMFFGSGNLIFPPFLGFQAGNQTPSGIFGFAITAIVFPVLSVIVIAKSGNLMNLASKVNHRFAILFTIVLFLAIGPGLAIPRNAAVSFEMAVSPFLGTTTITSRLVYSLLFFAISLLLSWKPESLIDWLGKILGPVLILLMIGISIACFIKAPTALAPANGAYTNNQILQGFMDGYNTMDTLAALNFGNIIALNIINKGIRERKSVVKYVSFAGIYAGLFLLLIYGILAYVGAISGASFTNATNGANVLTNIVFHLFGHSGVILLGIIYVLSCLTTCVGLTCSCGEYFTSISKISYHKWVILFTLGGFAFSIVGLNGLLQISVPFLTGIYPIAMVLVILGLFADRLKSFPHIFPCTILFTGIASVVYALYSAGIILPVITDFIMNIPPLPDLCWMIPAFIGFLIGAAHSKLTSLIPHQEEALQID